MPCATSTRCRPWCAGRAGVGRPRRCGSGAPSRSGGAVPVALPDRAAWRTWVVSRGERELVAADGPAVAPGRTVLAAEAGAEVGVAVAAGRRGAVGCGGCKREGGVDVDSSVVDVGVLGDARALWVEVPDTNPVKD